MCQGDAVQQDRGDAWLPGQHPVALVLHHIQPREQHLHQRGVFFVQTARNQQRVTSQTRSCHHGTMIDIAMDIPVPQDGAQEDGIQHLNLAGKEPVP